MHRATHIAKALTNKLGRLLTPPLGGWGVFLLLLAGTSYVHAQVNTASEPYLNSWHKYEVTMGDALNNTTYRWNIYNNIDDANNDLAESSPNRFLLDGETWIQNQVITGNIAGIELFFDETLFPDASNWYLVFSEISSATGACVARRRFDITIRDNNFYFTLPGDGSQCNSREGEVLNGDDITGKLASSVDFTFNMFKDADHLVDRWSVSGQISFTGALSYQAADVTFSATGNSDTRNEAWVLTDIGNGNFSLELDCDPDDAPYPDDAVTITVNLLGLVYQTVDVTLTLSDGQAYSGTSYEIITEDNLNKEGGDRAQTITIDGLPGFTNIAGTQ